MDSQTSLLFDLPPEIRNIIYYEVLVTDEVNIDCKAIHEQTSLLRVCSQIRDEAMQLFYCENKFVLSYPPWQTEELERFLSVAGPKNSSSIATFRLKPNIPARTREALVIFSDDTLTWVEKGWKLVTQHGTRERQDTRSIFRGLYEDHVCPLQMLANKTVVLGVHPRATSRKREIVRPCPSPDSLEGLEQHFLQYLNINFEYCVLRPVRSIIRHDNTPK